MNKGWYQREKRRVVVKRGPITFTQHTDIADYAPVADGVTVLSGQLISKDSDGNWVLGVAKGKEPFVALKDSDEPDVGATPNGYLPAVSLRGDYTIETAYYVDSGTYNVGDPLIAATGGNAGSFTLATSDSFTGDATEDIIATVQEVPADLNSGTGLRVDMTAEDSSVIVVNAKWVPARS